MQDFITAANFDQKKFMGIDVYDMFYWEHRLSKWQNVLCAEAEMASDVFIPFSNRILLEKFLSVPRSARKNAEIHEAVTQRLSPQLAAVEYV